MISLADAIRLESGNPAVNAFKPWWEVWVDYILNGFLIVVLFALAGVTISGTPGLTCLTTDTNQTSLNYATNVYLNAECTTHVDGHILIIYPYIILAQWLILFVLHISWFDLPSLKAFLASAFDTFQKLEKEANPRLAAEESSKKSLGKTNAQNELPSTSNSDGDDTYVLGKKSSMVYLVDWLQYMLQFKYHIVYLYVIKSVSSCAFNAIFSIGLISSLVFFQWKTTFPCDLQGIIPPPFDHSSCSFPAAPYVYTMMVLNVIFTLTLSVFNLVAVHWIVKFRFTFKAYLSDKWKHKHPLESKPGFYDYFFCMQMLKAINVEGTVINNLLEEAFKVFQNRLPEDKTNNVMEFPIMIPEDPKHYRGLFLLKEILQELGMSIKRSEHNDLWSALASSLDKSHSPLVQEALNSSKDEIRDCVHSELLKKHVLFKDLINKDNDCPLFEDYVSEIKRPQALKMGIKEIHYVLMAFSLAYKINVVVIRAKKSCLLYEPEQPEINQALCFIAFIQPHYFYATFVDEEASEDESLRMKFLTDQVYQTELLKKIQNRWESRGRDEYNKRLDRLLPKQLSFQAPVLSGSRDELEPNVQGVRKRAAKSNISDSNEIEQVALMELV